MKTGTLALAVAVLAGSIGTSGATESARCRIDSGPGKLSLEQAVGKAEGLGYVVKEAKRSKGCWKIEGFDRNGAEIEILFNPASGDVVRPRDWRAPSGG